MRTNLPVTGVEIHLAEGEYILSKADMQGNITYINRTFIEMSGFSEAELRGQPHNLLRHPDMPSEAFRDFWSTLKSGKSWSGAIKNRCKNGDHYWVMANASPIWQNGAMVGYMSVRTRPDRKQVEAAEELYRRMRNGESQERFEEGHIRPVGISGVWHRLGDITIRRRLTAVFGVTMSLWLLLGSFAYRGLQVGQALERNSIVALMVLGGGLIAYMLSRTYTVMTRPLAKMTTQMQEIAQGNLSLLVSRERHDEVGAASDAFKSMFIKLRFDMADSQRAADEAKRMGFALDNVATPVTLSSAENKLFYTNLAARRLLENIFKSPAAVDRLYGHPIVDSLTDPALQEITRGRLDKPLSAEGKVGDLLIRLSTSPVLDEKGSYMGRVCQWVDRTDEIAAEREMQTMMEEAERTGNEAKRLAVALDNVATPVTLSNAENNMFYTNQAARKLLEGIFKSSTAVDRLYGHPIVNSIDDPALQAITRGRLDKPLSADGVVGDRLIRLATSPVVNASGEYMGRVCQWVDRTAEVAAEREVQEIVGAAAAGDFSRRIEVNNKQGFFKTLAGDLNVLVESAENGLNDVVRVLNALAQGDLTQTIDRDYQGTFAQMKNDANATVAQLKTIVTSITESTDAINSAAKEIASGNADLSSRTESQASSLEETAASTEELTKTVRNNADNASKASALARTSSEVADRGGRVVNEVVQTMGAIADSSSKISEIISVIDGIAFQTNILALNAAVEAARAGEQGRGFAVVAGEVRNLAQRSASAAKEIKGLISESVTKVSNGYKLVETAGQTMQEIVSSTQNVSAIMNEISSASEEQRTGITQLNQAINSMDETTQQNAALVEQAAAAAQSLEDQAMSLMQAVSVFRVDSRERTSGLLAGNVERLPVRPVAARAQPVRKTSGAQSAARLKDEWEEF